jgi:polygalacturonase
MFLCLSCSYGTAHEQQVLDAGATNALYNVTDFGAQGDGVQLDTEAIQRAIDACTARGGGTVIVPPGKYRTATLVIKNNVTLYLSAGATIVATGDPKDYVKYGAVLYAQEAENIALTGRGTMDGSGGNVRTDRYQLLFLVHCRNVSMTEVTLRASAGWCAHLAYCDKVKINGVQIDNCVNFNNDGLDINSCRNVRISDCSVRCEDDAITLKTTADAPCENIVITNCILTSRWAGIRLGSESCGNFKNILVSNCAIHDTFGCGIKLQMVEGAEMRDLVFSNIVMTNVTGPICLRLGNWVTGSIPRPENAKRPIGTLKNVLFSNIRAQVAEKPCTEMHQTNNYPPSPAEPGEIRSCISITGQPDHPIENIVFSDVSVTFPGGGTTEEAARKNIPDLRDTYPEYYMFGVLPAYGLYAHHVKGLTLNNVRFELASPDKRPATVYDDVKEVRESSLQADGPVAQNAH